MSSGKLTQEEIDALLGNRPAAEEGPADAGGKSEASVTQAAAEQPAEPGGAGVAPSPGSAAGMPDIRNYLSELEEDVLGEIGNISFGSAATALSASLNQKVDITTPKVELVTRDELSNEFPAPYVSILVDYTEGFRGSCMLVIKTTDASVIASLMMGGDGKNPTAEIGEMEMSAVQEAMNQMMGSSSTAMSTVFNRKIDISPPQLTIMDVKSNTGTDYIPDEDFMFKISFRLRIGDLIDSNIMQLMPIDFAKELVGLLLSATGGVKEKPAEPKHAGDEAGAAALQQAAAAADAAEKEPPASPAVSDRRHDSQPAGKRRPETKPTNVVDERNVHPAEFSAFKDDDEPAATPQNIDLLMDIPLDISVELGRTKKTVKEVLDLSPGSIIELDKLAGEAIDILVNQKYIAKGEVVVVDENFGIRITEIMNHRDRLQHL